MSPRTIHIVVEGISDEAVARRLCQISGLTVSRAFVTSGKDRLDARLAGYNNAARFSPWLVLRDIDADADCAPDLCDRLLQSPAPQMLLRIPVRAVEAWLMADREKFSQYLKVSLAAVPTDPEALERPKREVVKLARRSRSANIKRQMVPALGTSSEVGPGYTAALIAYAQSDWRPQEAALISSSLRRCLVALHRLS